MAWCEAEGVDYLLGLAKNERLKAEIQDPMAEAEARYRHSGQAARVFQEFTYQTRESWRRARRVIAKAEYLEKGANPRFIVTSLPQQSGQRSHYMKSSTARAGRWRIASRNN